MSNDVIFEILHYKHNGKDMFDIKNPQYNTLNRYGLSRGEVVYAMHEIANVVNNDVGKGITFSLEW